MSEAKYESLLKEKESLKGEIQYWNSMLTSWKGMLAVALEIDNSFKKDGRYSKDLNSFTHPESERPYRELFFKPLSITGLRLKNPTIENLPGNIRRCSFSRCPITPEILETLQKNIGDDEMKISRREDILEELNRKIRRCKWSVRKDKVFRIIFCKALWAAVFGTVLGGLILYWLVEKLLK